MSKTTFGSGAVLASAYEYHPNGVSEAWSAYKLIDALKRRGRRMLVLTRASINKPRWYGVGRIRCAIPKVSGLWAANYAEFAIRSLYVARRLRPRVELVHQVSPITLRVPSAMGALPMPFVWGPVGGSIAFPPGFSIYAQEPTLSNVLRKMDRLRLRSDPSLLWTLASADRIVVTTTMAAENIPERWRGKTVVIPEGVADEAVLAAPVATDSYVFSSGRLIPYKAMDLLIRAMARLPSNCGIRLVITGEGSLHKRLLALIESLGLRNTVELRGRVSRAENQLLMSRSLFCVFPALREAFGHVNLEAMACWKPVIVTDWGGPRDVVSHNVTGLKVLGKNPREHVEMLADAMMHLIDDNAARERMGAAAAARVRADFTWSAVARRYEEVYAGVCR